LPDTAASTHPIGAGARRDAAASPGAGHSQVLCNFRDMWGQLLRQHRDNRSSPAFQAVLLTTHQGRRGKREKKNNKKTPVGFSDF